MINKIKIGLIIIFAFIFVNLFPSIVKNSQKEENIKNEIDIVNSKIADVNDKIAKYDESIKKLDDKFEQEKIARNNLKMVKEGEVIYKLTGEK